MEAIAVGLFFHTMNFLFIKTIINIYCVITLLTKPRRKLDVTLLIPKDEYIWGIPCQIEYVLTLHKRRLTYNFNETFYSAQMSFKIFSKIVFTLLHLNTTSLSDYTYPITQSYSPIFPDLGNILKRL